MRTPYRKDPIRILRPTTTMKKRGKYYLTVVFHTSVQTVEISMTDVANLYRYSKCFDILCQVWRIKLARLRMFGKSRKQRFIFECFIHNFPILQMQETDVVNHNKCLLHFNFILIQEVTISRYNRAYSIFSLLSLL
jgi:hypothetical protein